MFFSKDREYKYSYLLGKSSKIDKSDKYSDYENFIMYLSPYTLSGVNICPNASKGCASACLNTAGRGKFTSTQNSRLQRTLHYINNRVEFLSNLRNEIIKYANKHDKLAIRLNGTSDINWNPFIRQIHKINPNIVFYDYTKNLNQAIKALEMNNYYVTFSRSEENHAECMVALQNGINVAIVFKEGFPDKWNGYPVIDGDISDTRFLDEQGVIIGLSAKGKAKQDKTGFVV